MPADRVGFGCSAERIHPENHSPAHPGGLQAIPLTNRFRGHTELVGDAAERVSLAHPVAHQPALGLTLRLAGWNDQLVARGQHIVLLRLLAAAIAGAVT